MSSLLQKAAALRPGTAGSRPGAPVSAMVEAPTRVVLPRVNLLPPEIEESRRFRRVQTGLGGAVAFVLVLVVLGVLLASGAVGRANDDQTTATADQMTVKRETGTYKGVTDTYTRTAAVQAMLTQAMAREVRYSGFLQKLSVSMPANVQLNNISFTEASAAAGAAAPGAAAAPPAGATAGAAAGAAGAAAGAAGTVTMSGVAVSHSDVAAWLEAVVEQPGYGLPVLQSSTQAAANGTTSVTWSTTVPLTDAALSGRYTKVGD